MTPTEIIIEQFHSLYGNLYDYSKVNYIHNETKVEIICSKHGSFFKTVRAHKNGRGCPVCSRSNVRYTQKTLIEKFESIHDNTYDYTKVELINLTTKVKIICKKHGIFEQRPDQHIQGMGCFQCSIDRKIGTQVKYLNGERSENTQHPQTAIVNDKVSLFIKKATKKHGNLYDYSKIESYINGNCIVTIGCKIHGDFEQRIKNHLDGSGCHECGKNSSRFNNKNKPNILTDELKTKILIDEFKSVHGDLYDYSQTAYVNFKTKVAIICRKHGVFMQRTRCHASGKGCPTCRSSKGELRIREFLKNNNISFIEQFPVCKSPKTGSYLRADFYLPSFNTCIEYDGQQHFSSNDFFGGDKAFEETKYRDSIKNEYCKKENINLIRISYKEYKNIEKIISFLKS